MPRPVPATGGVASHVAASDGSSRPSAVNVPRLLAAPAASVSPVSCQPIRSEGEFPHTGGFELALSGDHPGHPRAFGADIQKGKIVFLPAQPRRQAGADMNLKDLPAMLCRQERLCAPAMQMPRQHQLHTAACQLLDSHAGVFHQAFLDIVVLFERVMGQDHPNTVCLRQQLAGAVQLRAPHLAALHPEAVDRIEPDRHEAFGLVHGQQIIGDVLAIARIGAH